MADFVSTLRKQLDEANTEAVVKTINSLNSPNCLTEILENVVVYLNKDVRTGKPKLFGCCKQVVEHVANTFDPEDVLLQLMGDIEHAKDDLEFVTLLNPVQMVLLRLEKKRLNSFAWGLNAVRSYLTNMGLPSNCGDLNADEKFLMDADPAVQQITSVYDFVIPFYQALIHDLRNSDIQDRKFVILKFIVLLLGRPFAFLNLKFTGKIKSHVRRIGERLIAMILELHKDVFQLIELSSVDTTCDIVTVDELSLGILFYMVIVEQIGSDRIPRVYHPIYVFHRSLGLTAELLKHDNQFLVCEGLSLAEHLLDGIDENITYRLLDCESHSLFCRNLTNVLIFNQLERQRRKGLEVFRKYLFKFEARGRYLLIYNLMKLLNHTGLIGYIITQYKDMLMEDFASNNHSSYLTGSNLFVLLDKFCYLHKGEESDIVELADQVVAALNLLRYLAIRDKDNRSGVWDHFAALREAYLEPLKKGLILSRAHYDLKIKQLQSENAAGDEKRSKVSIVVSGQQLPSQLPSNEKLKVCYSALTSFDVIESLLGRLDELIRRGPKTNPFFLVKLGVGQCKGIVRRSASTSSNPEPNSRARSEEHYDEDIKNKILEAALPFVTELGWSKSALSAGAEAIGYPGVSHGIFKRGGFDLVCYFQSASNKKLLEYLKQIQDTEKPLKPIQIVEQSIQERLKMNVPYLSRWPQAIAIMTLPPNVPSSLATLLTMVDDICYYSGDRSVDFNWYARRVAVAGVYKATELYMIQDRSEKQQRTWTFLNKRLGELKQVNDLLHSTDLTGQTGKDTITSAFVTARNILGLNWNR